MQALDLFCGCGGAGLGLRQAGFDVLGIDCDLSAVVIYRKEAGPAIQADVRDLDPRKLVREFGPIDLLWASPYQLYDNVRQAHQRLSGFDHQAIKLLLEPLRWVIKIGPRWVVVENIVVENTDEIIDYRLSALISRLEEIFPATTILRLNAVGWVAQERRHIFIVAGPRAIPIPAPPHTSPRFRDIADSTGAKPVEESHLRYALSRREYQTPLVGPNGVLPMVTTRPYHEQWTCFIMERPGFIRYPTFLESARAQGFPDVHYIHILELQRPSAAWRLLGNAVPVPLAAAVARAIVEADDAVQNP